MIVVDTNVMVGMVAGGPASEDAAALYAYDTDWTSPTILLSELRNVLLGSMRRGDLTMDQARASSEYAARILGNRVRPVDSAQVLDVAMECGLSAYDAEFVALARTLGLPLVTLDGGILDGAPDVAVRPRAYLDAV